MLDLGDLSYKEEICKGSLNGLLQQFEVQIAVRTLALRLPLRLTCIVLGKHKGIFDQNIKTFLISVMKKWVWNVNHVNHHCFWRTAQYKEEKRNACIRWSREVFHLIPVSWGQETCQREYTSL